MPARGKILVVRGGAIGDFILTLPVLAALRAQFPEAHLEVMGYAHIATLAQAAGMVDGVRSIEARSLAVFFGQRGSLTPGLAEYFAGFDLIISYLYDPDQIFQNNIKRCSRAQFIAGPYKVDERLAIHATECLLQPLERLAIFNPNPVPFLPLLNRKPVSPKPTLAFHPGSGSEHKNWPEPQWRELLALLSQEDNLHFLLVGGEAEGDRLERLATVLPENRTDWAHNLPLPELGRRLTACTAFIGHDSGISHLAAAVGLPGLILWGDTAEDVWRPRSAQMQIVRKASGLDGISVEDVLAPLQDLLGTLKVDR